MLAVQIQQLTFEALPLVGEWRKGGINPAPYIQMLRVKAEQLRDLTLQRAEDTAAVSVDFDFEPDLSAFKRLFEGWCKAAKQNVLPQRSAQEIRGEIVREHEKNHGMKITPELIEYAHVQYFAALEHPDEWGDNLMTYKLQGKHFSEDGDLLGERKDLRFKFSNDLLVWYPFMPAFLNANIFLHAHPQFFKGTEAQDRQATRSSGRLTKARDEFKKHMDTGMVVLEYIAKQASLVSQYGMKVSARYEIDKKPHKLKFPID